MSMAEFEGNMKIKCSPIINLNGKDVFLVNIQLVRDNDSISVCGIQLPQAKVTYCKGFTKGELDELVKYIKNNEAPLTDAASKMPPLPPDYPVEDLNLIMG